MESAFRIKLLPMPIALPDRSVRLSGYTTHCRIVNGLITSCTCVAPPSTGSSRSDDVNSDERSVIMPASTTVTQLDDDEQREKADHVGGKVSAPSDDVIQKKRLKKTLEKARRERERTRIMAGAFRALNDVLPKFTYVGKRLSQLCLLRAAVSYIRTLEHLLTLTSLDGDNASQSEPAIQRQGQCQGRGRRSRRSTRKRNCCLCDQHHGVYVGEWTNVTAEIPSLSKQNNSG